MPRGITTGELMNVRGDRGESMAYVALTKYKDFKKPLFRPAFLGEKWAAADFYAELTDAPGTRPVVLFQVKTTATGISATGISVAVSKRDIRRLTKIPIPTYILGVCEDTQRVFVRAVSKSRKSGITRIPKSHELKSPNLRKLHDEIMAFWKGSTMHRGQSTFS